jgi:hypothetical protein
VDRVSAQRAVIGGLSDDGVSLAKEWEPFAEWLAASDVQQDRWQAKALRALDTTALDPKYLTQRMQVWHRLVELP